MSTPKTKTSDGREDIRGTGGVPAESAEPLSLNDTGNTFMVGTQGNDIVILRSLGSGKLTKKDALNLAAWIVAVCPEHDFQKLLEAVQSA